MPFELIGHATAVQEELEKFGAVLVAETVPLKPALQIQPLGILAPFELIGQATAVHPKS